LSAAFQSGGSAFGFKQSSGEFVGCGSFFLGVCVLSLVSSYIYKSFVIHITSNQHPFWVQRYKIPKIFNQKFPRFSILRPFFIFFHSKLCFLKCHSCTSYSVVPTSSRCPHTPISHFHTGTTGIPSSVPSSSYVISRHFQSSCALAYFTSGGTSLL